MSQLDSIEEAVHLRDVHWVPVPESGSCPASHPNRLKSPEGQTRCYTDSAAAVLRRRARESDTEFSEQERPPLKTQTYILSKERFKTQAEADKWMDDNNAPRPKVDEKENTFRYRQFDPDRCEEGSARTIRITDGVQIVGCRLKPEFREAVTPFKDLPLAERTRAWDSGEAMARVRRWASTDDRIDFDRYSMAFLIVDGPRENLTSYKLPFADFFDGRLRAVPRGIFAAAAVLQGARGGIDLPSGDLTRAQNHLGQYYSKMELRPPWAPREALSEQIEKLTNERARLREANADNPTERCKFCKYFEGPSTCRIIDGPVAADQVCDWIFSRETEAGLYEIADEDWLAFVMGMIKQQPYQHIVRDGAITPAGPLVMIEDTAKSPHRFSLDKIFHVSHTSLEHHWTQAEVDELVAVGNRSDEQAAEVQEGLDYLFLEGVRPAFGSPGGKKLLAGTIVKLIPEHKKYVEPFVGGGAVLFTKKPSPIEVINDLDSEIAHAYRFMQRMSEGDVDNLVGRNNKFSREQFFRLRDSSPSGDRDKFFKFLYTNAFSFGRSRTSTVRTADGISSSGVLHKRYVRIRERVKPRLQGIRILSQDFRKVIAAHDGPGTFFYLDPPYPTQQGHLKTELTNEDLLAVVKKIRGRFMMSLPADRATRKVFKGYHQKIVHVDRTFENRNGRRHVDQEMILANFPMRTSSTWMAEAIPESILSESFRIDLTYKPDEEPTHEELEGRRQEIMKKFADFVKAEFPKGEVKVELENLIPKESREQEDMRDARFFLFDVRIQEVLPDGRRGPSFKTLKDNQVRLPENEREVAMKAKAVWHHGSNGEETCAIWKSIVRGETWYVCHTHRAMNVRPTLKAAIKQFHEVIKLTASREST